MVVEQAAQQPVELLLLFKGEPTEQLCLDAVELTFQVFKTSLSLGGEVDCVASSVGGVGLASDVVVPLELVKGTGDVAAVHAESATEFGLAKRPESLKSGEEGEVGAQARLTEDLGGEPSAAQC